MAVVTQSVFKKEGETMFGTYYADEFPTKENSRERFEFDTMFLQGDESVGYCDPLVALYEAEFATGRKAAIHSLDYMPAPMRRFAKQLARLEDADECGRIAQAADVLWEVLGMAGKFFVRLHEAKFNAGRNATIRYSDYMPAAMKQFAEQLAGLADAGNSDWIAQGTDVLGEALEMASELIAMIHKATPQAAPIATILYSNCMPAATIRFAEQLARLADGDDGGWAMRQDVPGALSSQLSPGLSTYDTCTSGTSAAVSGSSASSSGTSGNGSGLGMAQEASRGARQAKGQERFPVTYSFIRWLSRTFVIVNNTDFIVDVHVSSIALIKKLSSAGLSVGSSSLAINAAFDHFRAAERSSWTALPPGQSATYMLGGGYVSVLSQEQPTLGFFVDHWVRAGRKVSVLGRPLPIRTMAPPAAVAQPAAMAPPAA